MYLKRLNDYWLANFPDMPNGYTKVTIQWVIDLDSDGKLLAFTPLLSEEAKGLERIMPMPVPRTSGVAANFLYDKAEYVLGIVKSTEESNSSTDERALKNKKAFIEVVRNAWEFTQSPLLQSIVKWYENSGEAELITQASDGLDSGHLLAFRVNGIWINDDVDVRKAYENIKSKEAESLPNGQCAITLEQTQIIRVSKAPVKGVPGTQTSGIALYACDSDSTAFAVFDTKETFNASIGWKTDENIGRALNYLIASPANCIKFHDLKQCYVVWCDNSENDVDLSIILGYAENSTDRAESVRNYINSIRSGKNHQNPNETAHIMVLSGATARIAVKHYAEFSVSELRENLNQWIEYTKIETNNGMYQPRLETLALAMATKEEMKPLPRNVELLVKAALYGSSLPKSILSKLVARDMRMRGPYEIYKKKRVISYSRLSLYQLHFRRAYSTMNIQTQPSFAAGQLFAHYQSLQYSAIGDVNANIADKFYGKALVSPRLVFNNLNSLATKHLGTLRKKNPAAAIVKETQMREFIEAIGLLPARYNDEERALFTMGYNHYRTQMFKNIEENKATKAALASQATIEGN